MPTVHSIPGDLVAWREVDGEFVLISVETTHYYALNSSGSDVWRILLEGPRSAESIAATLAACHGVDAAAIGSEVSALLEELSREGLVRADEAGEPHPAAGLALTIEHNGGYQPPILLKYDELERLILSGE